MKAYKRVFLIVLDSFGIGAEPDAAEFGDGDVNTLRTIAASPAYATANLARLGLFNIDGVGCGAPRPGIWTNTVKPVRPGGCVTTAASAANWALRRA